ncbi:histone arginine demethylase [Thraustotheca clavata]|uniref:Histone arginine demethylase n=1 Tax=Thraustotheca clavata TaxID=74557 RepID=A0A1V9ZME5_9STRA|nr:histone arginine demethylase [Thraustotheca clavata]
MTLLTDELKVYLTLFLPASDLLALAATSKVWYVFCNEEPLWKIQVLRVHEGNFCYRYSWKYTFFYPRHDPVRERPQLPQIAIPPQSLTSDFLYRRYCRRHMHLVDFYPHPAVQRTIPNLPITTPNFAKHYGRQPVMLTGACTSWPSLFSDVDSPRTWTLDNLVERFGDVSCRITHNLDVESSVSLTFRDYKAYVERQSDETPLYIFDSRFAEKMPELLDDYTIPVVFDEDLLSFVHASQRPDFRWLVIGPARAGAPWHLDPVKTSAWNSLLVGRKRWAMYPPNHPPPGVNIINNQVHMTSLEWYLNIYPTLSPDQLPYEVVQYPGETIYVPSGWWHLVLNLDLTIAVTQNFVDANNLPSFVEDVIESGDGDVLDVLEPFVNPSLATFLRLYRLPQKFGYLNEDALVESFSDCNKWSARIHQVLEDHDLVQQFQSHALKNPASSALRAVTSRVNPAFVVHDHAIVKYFSPLNVEWGDCPLSRVLSMHFPNKATPNAVGVIKFLESAYDNECLLYSAMAVNPKLAKLVPQLFGNGHLIKPHQEEWRWPYVIISYDPNSVSLCDILHTHKGLTQHSWDNLVEWLGKTWCPQFYKLPVMSQASACSLTPRSSIKWYIEYLQELRAQCVAVHIENGILPRHLLDSLDKFLPPMDAMESLVLATTPSYLHCDFTTENLLGRVKQSIQHELKRVQLVADMKDKIAHYCQTHDISSLEQFALDEQCSSLGLSFRQRWELVKATQQRRMESTSFLFKKDDNEEETHEAVFDGSIEWTPTTVIDFADAKCGDPIWDLIPIIFSVLHADPKLVQKLLKMPFWSNLLLPHRASLPTILLSLTLLHPSQSTYAMLHHFPTVQMASSWHEISLLVFGSMLP